MASFAALLQTLGGVASSTAKAKQELSEEDVRKKQVYSQLESAALQREHLRQMVQQAQGNPILRLRRQLKEAGLTDEQAERYLGVAPKEYAPKIVTETIVDKNSPTGRSYVSRDAATGKELSRQLGAPAPAPKAPQGAQLRQNAAGELEWFIPPTATDPKGKVVGTGVKGKPPATRRDPLDALQAALAKSDYIAARKIVNTSQVDYLAALKLMRTMDEAKTKAILGDQQAQFAITANHILMTAGQKGGRVSQAMYKQAEESAPMLGRINARFDNNGYLTGVVLTPEQISSMVNLAHDKVKIMKQTLDETRQAYSGDLSLRKGEADSMADPLGIRK
jgi:hypothetical protein